MLSDEHAPELAAFFVPLFVAPPRRLFLRLTHKGRFTILNGLMRGAGAHARRLELDQSEFSSHVRELEFDFLSRARGLSHPRQASLTLSVLGRDMAYVPQRNQFTPHICVCTVLSRN